MRLEFLPDSLSVENQHQELCLTSQQSLLSGIGLETTSPKLENKVTQDPPSSVTLCPSLQFWRYTRDSLVVEPCSICIQMICNSKIGETPGLTVGDKLTWQMLIWTKSLSREYILEQVEMMFEIGLGCSQHQFDLRNTIRIDHCCVEWWKYDYHGLRRFRSATKSRRCHGASR